MPRTTPPNKINQAFLIFSSLILDRSSSRHLIWINALDVARAHFGIDLRGSPFRPPETGADSGRHQQGNISRRKDRPGKRAFDVQSDGIPKRPRRFPLTAFDALPDSLLKACRKLRLGPPGPEHFAQLLIFANWIVFFHKPKLGGQIAPPGFNMSFLVVGCDLLQGRDLDHLPALIQL
jgi:hypothetical protein